MELIDKDALVAEMEKMLQEEYPCDNAEQTTGYHCALYELQDYLDTLEVKEVQEEPIGESFQEWEKRYLEEHKEEIINVYDRHVGLIDGAIWQAFHITKNAMSGNSN